MKLHGTRCRDWEDIAINRENGKSYIYLGDFGDNAHRRSSLTIYKFEEPEVNKGRDVHISANKIKHIHVKYPNNKRYDCEAMAVDPYNNDILLFTKNNGNRRSHVYRVPHGARDPKTLEYVTTLPYRQVTGRCKRI